MGNMPDEIQRGRCSLSQAATASERSAQNEPESGIKMPLEACKHRPAAPSALATISANSRREVMEANAAPMSPAHAPTTPSLGVTIAFFKHLQDWVDHQDEGPRHGGSPAAHPRTPGR